MTPHRSKLPGPWSPRRRPGKARPEPSFVPVSAVVGAIREVRRHFESGNRIVILHGPAGSGKSTIAARVGQLWNGRVELRTAAAIEGGSSVTDDSETQRTSFRSGRKRADELLIVDELTLRHADLGVEDAVARLDARSRTIIVSSTAWWLERGTDCRIPVKGVSARLLGPEEVAHLVNGLTWTRDPKAPPADASKVEEIYEISEGRMAEAVRLASAVFPH